MVQGVKYKALVCVQKPVNRHIATVVTTAVKPNKTIQVSRQSFNAQH